MRKNNRFRNAIMLKCPVCGQCSMFENPKTFTLHKIGNVKTHCEVCQCNLKPETGFYFGAAYVNWALTVALWVSVLVALKTFNFLGWIEFGFLTNPVMFLTTGFIFTLILFPYVFRLSRSIWAAFFVTPKDSSDSSDLESQQ